MRSITAAVILVLISFSLVHGMDGILGANPFASLMGSSGGEPPAELEGVSLVGVTKAKIAASNLRGRATFEFAGGAAPVTGAVHDYRLIGPWAELNQVVFLGEKTELVFTGGYLFPSDEYVSEDYQTMFGFRQRNLWSTETQLWTAGIALTHKIWGPFTVAAGYSFNSFDMVFKSLDLAEGPLPGFVTSQSVVEVDAHTPYVGLMMEYRSRTAGLNVGVLCCPAFIGDLQYKVAAPLPNNPSRIYGPFKHTVFAGVAMEYSVLSSLGYVGIFGRWLSIQGGFDLSFDGGTIDEAFLRVNADFWMAGVHIAIPIGFQP